jgi:hypothetical protein
LPEVTRALRALSSAYVERRHALARGAALDSAGKRAAFALFYGPLHYLIVSHVLESLGSLRIPSAIVDLGCGTGAAGAAWATSLAGPTRVAGIDKHPWAVSEARWTYRCFGIDGQARAGDLVSLPSLAGGGGIVAAYVLNELPESSRLRLESRLLRAGEAGTQVVIVEPLARRITPWWKVLASRALAAGGRADEWRFRADLPELVARLDTAAGLDHTELTARSLTLNLGR